MWNVPAKAAAGSTASSRSLGSRERSMLTLSWAPSGASSVGTGSAPAAASRVFSTVGAHAAWMVVARAEPPSQVTSPSGVDREHRVEVRISAPDPTRPGPGRR